MCHPWGTWQPYFKNNFKCVNSLFPVSLFLTYNKKTRPNKNLPLIESAQRARCMEGEREREDGATVVFNLRLMRKRLEMQDHHFSLGAIPIFEKFQALQFPTLLCRTSPHISVVSQDDKRTHLKVFSLKKLCQTFT